MNDENPCKNGSNNFPKSGANHRLKQSSVFWMCCTRDNICPGIWGKNFLLFSKMPAKTSQTIDFIQNGDSCKLQESVSEQCIQGSQFFPFSLPLKVIFSLALC